MEKINVNNLTQVKKTGNKLYINKKTDNFPVGSVIWVATQNAPLGFLVCNGNEVSRTIYSDLFAVIGTTYGAGDGSTTFNLPNLLNKTVWGSLTVGENKEAGLPNITGKWTYISTENVSGGIPNSNYPCTGAAGYQSVTSNIKFLSESNTSNTAGRDLTFDAAKSNVIYGKSSTVQPPALTLLPCIKAYGHATNPGSADLTSQNFYLPLSGGRLSGTLYVKNRESGSTDTIHSIIGDDSSKEIAICADNTCLVNEDTGGGATIYLHGSDTPTDKGSFSIATKYDGNRYNLNGYASGELTWDGIFRLKTNKYATHAIGTPIPLIRSYTKILDGATTETWRSDNIIFALPSSTNDGSGVMIQGGGLTIVASGESGNNYLKENTPSGGLEQLYNISDNNIYFETACQTIANRKEYVLANTYFQPTTTNTSTLGASGHVWKQLFAGTTTISTSDERYKQDITKIDDTVLKAWEEVKFYQFRFKDAYEEKGENARYHLGVIAQRIKEAFEKYDIDPFKYGLLCYDEWDDAGDPDGYGKSSGNKYSVRYEECLCLECEFQRRKSEKQEEKIKQLEERLEKLEKLLV